MIRTELDIRTADGLAHAWTYCSGDGPLPGVILYVDAFGVRPAVHAMAERLANLGYCVLVPNVFYRAGEYAPFDPEHAFEVPEERERIMRMIDSITPERLGVDGGAYLDALAAQPGVRADRLGITGYCMGGRMAFLTAAQHPEKVRAAASFHGGGFVTNSPASPHLLANRIQASLYFGVADNDRGCSPEHQGVLATALAEADVEYRIELYRGKKHGFAMSDRPGIYDRDAAERHWRRLEEFFGETLG